MKESIKYWGRVRQLEYRLRSALVAFSFVGMKWISVSHFFVQEKKKKKKKLFRLYFGFKNTSSDNRNLKCIIHNLSFNRSAKEKYPHLETKFEWFVLFPAGWELISVIWGLRIQRVNVFKVIFFFFFFFFKCKTCYKLELIIMLVPLVRYTKRF